MAASIELVSVSSAGEQGDDMSEKPSLSTDGRFVALQSDATNLVPGDSNDDTDVFLVDRETGTISRVSVAVDGSLVAFESLATKLVPGDKNATSDILVAAIAQASVPGTVTGTDGNDEIQPGKMSKGVIGEPTDGDDVIDARGGADQVRAGGGNDTLYGDGATFIGGAAGKDKLSGDAGDDHLWGDFGGELADGPGGADQLTGGPGRDTFHLGRGEDKIGDFLQGEDVLDLGQLDLTIADLDSDGDGLLTSADAAVTAKGKTVTLDLGAALGEAPGVDVSSIVVGKGVVLAAGDFEALA